MRAIKKYTLCALLLMIGFTLTAEAQQRGGQGPDRQRPNPPSYEELLEMMDRNDDGKLAENEVKGPLARDFHKIDENEDGYITEAELLNAAPGNKRRRRGKNEVTLTAVFKEMDTNKDKKIEKDEAKNQIAERFDEFDLDNDGFISKIEMGKALKQLQKNK